MQYRNGPENENVDRKKKEIETSENEDKENRRMVETFNSTEGYLFKLHAGEIETHPFHFSFLLNFKKTLKLIQIYGFNISGRISAQ